MRHRLFASVRNLLVEAYSISDVMADSVLEIAITQYTRNRFARNDDFPYVWAIALIGTPDDWVYLLNGTPPDATYLGPLRQTDITASGAYRGHIVLGTVNADQKSRIEEIIKSVTIYTDRTDWNCQNWVLSGLRRLQSAGFLGGETFTFQGLTAALLQAENDLMGN